LPGLIRAAGGTSVSGAGVMLTENTLG